MALTHEHEKTLATLTIAYPGGVVIGEDRVEDIEVCEGLVESGHLVRVEWDGFDGQGYQLSAEMAEAHRRVIRDRADEAGQN